MSGYGKAELMVMIEAAKDNMAQFYQQDFVNYRGKTTDTGEYYTELIAEWCLDNLATFDKIPQVTRANSYKTVSHDGLQEEPSKREEEIIAKEMFRQGGVVGLGSILDYQTPLKNVGNDKAGKIDLLSADGGIVRILELKKPDSDETMLRCVLECETYRRTVDDVKLIGDFDQPKSSRIVAGPLVFAGSKQHQEMLEDRPQLKALMAELGSEPIAISKDDDGVYVAERI